MGIYDDLFNIAVALTNFHLKSHPLRSQDVYKLVQLRNILLHIARETAEYRKRVLFRYQERQRRRLNLQFRRNQLGVSSNHETTD